MNPATVIVLRIDHKSMTLKQLLQRLRVGASLAEPERCKDDLAIECWAETLGIDADTAELQAAVTAFRRANGLYTTVQASEWLEQRGMTLDDLVDLLKPQVLRERITRHIVSDDEIVRHYHEWARDYDRAEISMIVTEEYGAAQELRFRVEDGSDFHMLARRYSSDDATAKAGGYVGFIGREALEHEIAAAVFNAARGALLGPFEHKNGYSLILVEALYPAELDEAVEASIRELLFAQKLEAYRRTLEIHEDL
ncbi:Chaperone SurA [Paenibacillus solanacearum]|uniref:peptidylprolyl isomerase n=1 Tax=Paenibacillus solanacearum TaxID=2048548 RepID=A0A916JWV7_9BACL|nr:peptidylprolyl isomerase [Paenibacillus solanacearum]CAG7610415.1 Chaperone SurA [Paenibacillus solanacearum]